MPEPSPVNHAAHESDELTRTVSVIRVGLRGLYRSQLPRMAAALAYRTIFSVIPVLAIVLVIASSFVEPDQVRQSFTRMLEYAGFETISVATDDVSPANLVTVEPEDATFEPGAEPEASPEEIGVQAMDELITGLVDRVTSSLGSINRGWIGFISAGVFIYAALSLFLEMERSFNQIYRAARGRPGRSG